MVWSCYKFLCQAQLNQPGRRSPYAAYLEMEMMNFDRAMMNSSSSPSAQATNGVNVTVDSELMVCAIISTHLSEITVTVTEVTSRCNLQCFDRVTGGRGVRPVKTRTSISQGFFAAPGLPGVIRNLIKHQKLGDSKALHRLLNPPLVRFSIA